MVVSAQLRLGGFYTAVTGRIARATASPERLLALLVAVAGLLSALLANDVICLAMTPILIDACARRRLDPVPFLFALAAASNVGSAATLIGNPQVMLIGQRLGLDFVEYLAVATPRAVIGLALPRVTAPVTFFLCLHVRHDPRTQACRRRQHPVVRHQVSPRARHERDQSFDQDLRRKHYMRAAILPDPTSSPATSKSTRWLMPSDT
jgi:Na+/H+ antiporter NhaD/arsenite permease-like protein